MNHQQHQADEGRRVDEETVTDVHAHAQEEKEKSTQQLLQEQHEVDDHHPHERIVLHSLRGFAQRPWQRPSSEEVQGIENEEVLHQTVRSLGHEDEVNARAQQKRAEGGTDEALPEGVVSNEGLHEQGAREEEEPLEAGDVDVVGDVDADEVVDCPQVEVEGDHIWPGIFEHQQSMCGLLEVIFYVVPDFWKWFFTLFLLMIYFWHNERLKDQSN